MEKVIKQYEQVVGSALEISQTLLDMEGGRYILAAFSELIQGLLDEGNISGAVSVMRKLHEAVEVPIERDMRGENNVAAWVTLFAGALGDAFEESVF